jgi:hypothetical protein
VVFFDESAQIWNVAVDPTANAISKRMYGIGTKAPVSCASFFSDLVFLSPFGFRSMTVQAVTNRIDDNDVGTPIDSLVAPDIATSTARATRSRSWASGCPSSGQYWAVFDMGTYSKAWVYTFSRSSKIACWSEYTFPIRVTAITTLAGTVYLRTDTSLYAVDATKYTDDSTLINVEVQMAFQDAKTPGVGKQFYGADVVTTARRTCPTCTTRAMRRWRRSRWRCPATRGRATSCRWRSSRRRSRPSSGTRRTRR